MIGTTSTDIPGKKVVEILGIVKGNTVRAKNIGRDIAQGFKNIAGGEIKSYTDLLVQDREESYNRMVNEAVDLDADAVIGMRFMTSIWRSGRNTCLRNRC